MNDTAAILQAVRDGDMPVVERLLSADPRLVRARDEYLKTPLHWAAEHDRRDVAQMLLDSGADLEATTSWGATALDWAAAMGSTKVADLLLAHMWVVTRCRGRRTRSAYGWPWVRGLAACCAWCWPRAPGCWALARLWACW